MDAKKKRKRDRKANKQREEKRNPNHSGLDASKKKGDGTVREMK